MLPTSAPILVFRATLFSGSCLWLPSDCLCERTYFLFRLMRLGKPENRFDQAWKRFRNMVREVVTSGAA